MQANQLYSQSVKLELTNPPAQSTNDFLPVFRIAHHNFPTLIVVRFNSHLRYIFRASDTKSLVNFKFLKPDMTEAGEM